MHSRTPFIWCQYTCTAIEFSLNDFLWIQRIRWIMTKSKSGMATYVFTDEVVLPSELLQGNTDIFVITTRIGGFREGTVLVVSVCLSVQGDFHVTTAYHGMWYVIPSKHLLARGRWPSTEGLSCSSQWLFHLTSFSTKCDTYTRKIIYSACWAILCMSYCKRPDQWKTYFQMGLFQWPMRVSA